MLCYRDTKNTILQAQLIEENSVCLLREAVLTVIEFCILWYCCKCLRPQSASGHAWCYYLLQAQLNVCFTLCSLHPSSRARYKQWL